nr:MAG TPA: hypothetical protein [Caudoviricetes sp.]
MLKLAKEHEDYYNTVHVDADGFREKFPFDWKW